MTEIVVHTISISFQIVAVLLGGYFAVSRFRIRTDHGPLCELARSSFVGLAVMIAVECLFFPFATVVFMTDVFGLDLDEAGLSQLSFFRNGIIDMFTSLPDTITQILPRFALFILPVLIVMSAWSRRHP